MSLPKFPSFLYLLTQLWSCRNKTHGNRHFFGVREQFGVSCMRGCMERSVTTCSKTILISKTLKKKSGFLRFFCFYDKSRPESQTKRGEINFFRTISKVLVYVFCSKRIDFRAILRNTLGNSSLRVRFLPGHLKFAFVFLHPVFFSRWASVPCLPAPAMAERANTKTTRSFRAVVPAR